MKTIFLKVVAELAYVPSEASCDVSIMKSHKN